MIEPAATPLVPLLDALHCGAALVDRRGFYAHVNPRLAELHQRPAEDLVGRPVADAYQDPQAAAFLGELLRDFDRPTEGEFFVEQPGGARAPVVFAARPLDLAPGDTDAGRSVPTFLVVTVLEIADQREAFDRVAELSDTVLERAMRLRDDNHDLEAAVRQRTAELHDANMAALTMLAVASEARDEDTGQHVRRIERYTAAVARHLGLSEFEAQRLGRAAILHDVGKIHIPDHILKKPGPLTDDERATMQQHTVIGQRILGDRPFFATARLIARHHHENHDGTGYPDGLAGDDVSLPARIVHVVDVFDALASPRIYKQAWPPERARAAVAEARGTAFDPDTVDAFLAALDAGEL
ncbi:MAG: HD domain-containing phosphohydrolase [Planctomycetota bacterium]